MPDDSRSSCPPSITQSAQSLTQLSDALKRRNKAAMDKKEAPKAANKRKIASVLARIMAEDEQDGAL